jgi:hypothetical protein
MLPAPPPLACVDSRKSPYVQAADIAAGIARWFFENILLDFEQRLIMYSQWTASRGNDRVNRGVTAHGKNVLKELSNVGRAPNFSNVYRKNFVQWGRKIPS